MGHHATNPQTSYRDQQSVGEANGFGARVHPLQGPKENKGDDADENGVNDDCLLLAHLNPFLDKRLPNRAAGKRERRSTQANQPSDDSRSAHRRIVLPMQGRPDLTEEAAWRSSPPGSLKWQRHQR